MKSTSLIILTTTAVAATLPTKLCQEFKLSLTVTSENVIFGAPQFQNNFDVVDLLTDAVSRTAATDFHPFSGVQNQTATYTISSTFCTPQDKTAENRETVLIATHGLNFDRKYWDSGIQPEKYSFVDYVISQGYSIFFYDRLGVGKSSQVSGYLNQLSIQSAILQEIARTVRSGNYPGSIGIPKSLILVGHSFGSVISAAAATAQPGISEGLVLTGFGFNGTNNQGLIDASQLRIASSSSPARWRQLDSGYLIPVDIYSNVNVFFKKPDYDMAVAKWADDNKQPWAVTELIGIQTTLPGGKPFQVGLAPIAYKGAAMIMIGQYDLPICTGQCDDVIDHPASEIFGKARVFKAISYSGSGHAINFALNATGAYKEIFDFITASGL